MAESTNRALWSGQISYGLLMVPVKLYTAQSENKVEFRQVHREDAGRIKFRRICSVDGDEIPYSDIAKGYELPNGEIIVLTDEDFADLPLPTAHSIEIQYFCDPAEVPLGQYEKPYFVGPDKEIAHRAYRLLAAAMEETGEVAVCLVAVRNRESLAVLRPDHNGVLMLHLLSWPAEMREPGFEYPGEDVAVDDKELRLGVALVNAQSQAFDADAHTDGYEAAVQAMVAAKMDGKEMEPAPERAPAPAISLTAALEASLAQVKPARRSKITRGPTTSKPAHDAKAPAKSSGQPRTRSKSSAK